MFVRKTVNVKMCKRRKVFEGFECVVFIAKISCKVLYYIQSVKVGQWFKNTGREISLTVSYMVVLKRKINQIR